jgi:hypothetical protein
MAKSMYVHRVSDGADTPNVALNLAGVVSVHVSLYDDQFTPHGGASLHIRSVAAARQLLRAAEQAMAMLESTSPSPADGAPIPCPDPEPVESAGDVEGARNRVLAAIDNLVSAVVQGAQPERRAAMNISVDEALDALVAAAERQEVAR